MLEVPGRGELDLTCDEIGSGLPFVLLHGETGPSWAREFGRRLAAAHPARVIVPTLPGFAGTDRPDWLDGPAALGEAVAALLDALELTEVALAGGGLGALAAVELAVLLPRRLARLVLLDGVTCPGDPDPAAAGYKWTVPDQLSAVSTPTLVMLGEDNAYAAAIPSARIKVAPPALLIPSCWEFSLQCV